MNTRHTVICVALSALLSTAACAAVWTLWLRPPVLVTFDMKGTVNAFIRQSAKLDLDDSQRRQLLARFDRNLTTVTAQYAQAHHAAVLVSPAAVTGLPDATGEIRARLSAAMQSAPPQTSQP